MIKFTVLSENRANNEKSLAGESGLSVLVEVDGKRFLLDTGYSNLFLTNANKMGIDLGEIKDVVITHGHSDHTNGVVYLDGGKNIILHPQAFKSRYSIRKQEYAGFPITKEELKQSHNVIEAKDAIEVLKDVFFIGEVPMVVDFESNGNFSTTIDDEYKIKDKTEDDSGVAIKTSKGLFVMTGCGHRGVCNTIEQAKKITGEDRVYGVFGGFHLRKLEKQQETIDKTIEYFNHNGVQELYLGHCVTDDVIDYIETQAPDIAINRLQTGKEFVVEKSMTCEQI